MSFVNWLRGVKAKVDIEPIEDGNVILQNNGDGTADLFVDQGNQRLHVIDSTQTSGGHTIWNRIKTALTARANLWFKDANVSDASTDGATAVEVVTELQSESAFDNLATDGSADGAYVFPDSGDEYLDAYMVGYNNGSVGDALDDINDELTPSTALTFATGNTSYISNVRRTEYVKVGKVVTFNIFFDLGASPTNGSVLFTINDSTLFPKINSVVPLVGVYNNTAFKVNLSTNGNIEFNSTQTISANLFYAISGTYICV